MRKVNPLKLPQTELIEAGWAKPNGANFWRSGPRCDFKGEDTCTAQREVGFDIHLGPLIWQPRMLFKMHKLKVKHPDDATGTFTAQWNWVKKQDRLKALRRCRALILGTMRWHTGPYIRKGEIPIPDGPVQEGWKLCCRYIHPWEIVGEFAACGNAWCLVRNQICVTCFVYCSNAEKYVSQTLVCCCDQFGSPFTEHDPRPTIVHVKAIWNVLVVAHLKPFVNCFVIEMKD